MRAPPPLSATLGDPTADALAECLLAGAAGAAPAPMLLLVVDSLRRASPRAALRARSPGAPRAVRATLLSASVCLRAPRALLTPAGDCAGGGVLGALGARGCGAGGIDTADIPGAVVGGGGGDGPLRVFSLAPQRPSASAPRATRATLLHSPSLSQASPTTGVPASPLSLKYGRA